MRGSIGRMMALSAVLCACGDDGGAAEADGEGSGDTSATDGGESGTGGVDNCGNGVIDSGEECDDPDGPCSDDCEVLGEHLWTASPGVWTTGWDRVTDVVIDPSGDIIVTGSVVAYTAENETTSWLAKYSPGGAERWTVELSDDPGSFVQSLTSPVVDADGTIYALAGDSLVYSVLAFASDGSTLWDHSLDEHQASALSLDADGRLRVVSAATATVEPSTSITVIELSTAGERLATTSVDPEVGGPFGLRQARRRDDGSLMLAGGVMRDFTEDAVLLDVTADLEVTWLETVDKAPGQSRHFNDFVLLPDGAVVAIGDIWEEDDLVVSSARRYDQGELSWEQSFGTPDAPHWLLTVALAGPDEVLLGGSIGSGWVATLDPTDGELLWQWAPQYSSRVESIAVHDGDLLVAGSDDGNLTFNPFLCRYAP